MARRLYYRDSYGRVHQDRRAGRPAASPARPAMPARFFVRVLLLLAAIVVLASLVH